MTISWCINSAVCFLFVFAYCFPCLVLDDTVDAVPVTALVATYAVAAALFNVGWAAVQVSHMSLIPDLSPVAEEQVLLNSGRYAFTIMANLSVFAFFYVLLHFVGQSGFGNDGFKFRVLALFVVGLGGCASTAFLVGTREPPHPDSEEAKAQELLRSGGTETPPQCKMTPKDWLKRGLFYSVGVVYMCTRLTVNQSQVYIPFYVLHSTKLAVGQVAMIPFIVYCSSLVSTAVVKDLNHRIGRRYVALAWPCNVLLYSQLCAGTTPLAYRGQVDVLRGERSCGWRMHLVAVRRGCLGGACVCGSDRRRSG